MPDLVSHLVWIYVMLKHPTVEALKDFKTWKGKLSMYVFGVLPDLGNVLMMITLVYIMSSNNLERVAGPDAMQYEIVREAYDGWVRNIYYIFHSYVTYTVLLILLYIVLKRIYWPLVLGTGLHLTLDVFTHKVPFALKPLYPLLDYQVNGFFHWGSWTFYILQAIILSGYTVWLFKRKKK